MFDALTEVLYRYSLRLKHNTLSLGAESVTTS
jgi:hypothetical protein